MFDFPNQYDQKRRKKRRKKRRRPKIRRTRQPGVVDELIVKGSVAFGKGALVAGKGLFKGSKGLAKWVNKKRVERKGGHLPILEEIENIIKNFKPFREHHWEYAYQIDLARELKKDFPNTVIEAQFGRSRPDIVVEKNGERIAIEIKGPTGNSELATIADKMMRYGIHFNHFVAVLFELKANSQLFKEWEEGIKRHFPDAKIIIMK